MKTAIILTASIFLSFLLSAQIPQENLVAHFPLDGDATDITEYQNHGVIFGSVKVGSDRNQIEGNALFFDSETGYIDVESNDILNITQEITISVWIKPESYDLTGFTSLVNKWEDVPGPGGIGYYLGINPETPSVRWNTGSTRGDGAEIPENEWSHIAVTYSMDSLKIYQNNVLTQAVPYSDTLMPHDLPLRIGYQSDPFPTSKFFHGSMDEILIYDRALSEEEIDQIFNTNTTHTADPEKRNTFSVFPNPFSEYLNIHGLSTSIDLDEIVDAKIIDINGSLIKKFKVTGQHNTLPTDEIPSGSYLLLINRSGTIEKHKIVKYRN